MASILKVDDLRGNTTANDITVTVGASVTQSLKNGIAKTWFRYDQRTGPTVDASLNVSSITDDATGKYSVNLTNAISAENDVSLSAQHSYEENMSQNASIGQQEFGTETTTELEGNTHYNGTLYDCAQVFGQQYGDLA